MPQSPPRIGGLPPTWLIVVGSAAILFHLAAIIIPILDTPSGPWATAEGRNVAEPPLFAHSVNGLSTLHAETLRIAHSYHFVIDHPGELPGVEFLVRLRDADGKPFSTLRFPDAQANPWVRHRQKLLASALAPDFPVAPPGGEVIAAPGGKVPTFDIWLMPEERIPGMVSAPASDPQADPKVQLRLQSVPQHLLPRNRQIMRPSEWSVLLARSYSRYLCRKHGAATAEIIRLTREPVSPMLLNSNDPKNSAFEDLVASFGEVSK